MVFGNPAALWALLAVPALLVIHLLQARVRPRLVTTLFLLERAAADPTQGRTWRRLRKSRSLLAQLAALLLATWLLLDPRVVRDDSRQTIVYVLDASVSLEPFRGRVAEAVASHAAARAGLARSTRWVVLSSTGRDGTWADTEDVAELSRAIDAWRPRALEHDPRPALRLAGALVGAEGEVVFVTDRPGRVPAGTPTLGVGRAFPNVGFVGVAVETRADGGPPRWRAFVRHAGEGDAARTWRIEIPGAGPGASSRLELGTGGLTEISGDWPAGERALEVVLEGDGFGLDDRLPLILPEPKPLAWAFRGVTSADPGFVAVAEVLAKVMLGVPGARQELLEGRPVDFAIRVGVDAADGAALVLPVPGSGSERADRAPILAERHPLVEGLNWSGWLGAPTGTLRPSASAETLLWQGERPLAWLEGGAGVARRLVVDADWTRTNAPRLPAAVLLVRRMVLETQAALPVPFAANLETGQRIDLGWMPDGAWAVRREGSGPEVVEGARRAVLRAPLEPGFFAVEAGGAPVLRAAAHLADPRVTTFLEAATFAHDIPARGAVLEQRTEPEPWTPLWTLLLPVALFVAWWPARNAGGAR